VAFALLGRVLWAVPAGYGKFTVRVTPPGGGAPIEKKVDSVAGKGRVTVDFVVPGTSGGGACPAAKVK
jgi:hypothetical protein